MLTLIAAAQLLGMTLWFSATAAAPSLASELSISPATMAWLTMAVQAGFVAGTLISAMLNLADVLNARRLFALGCVAGAVANAAIALAESAGSVIALRFATGLALACVYPPGLKIAAGWFLERRGAALGIVVGALTFGSAFPHMLAWLADGVPWRVLMALSSVLALGGAAIVALWVQDGPYVSASAPFDRHAVGLVLRNRGVRLATLGYLGHMWELYAMWTWIGVMATASFRAAGTSSPDRAGAIAAFLAIASGTAGCALAGWYADRLGRARIAIWSLWTSATCAALTIFVFGAAPIWFYLLTMVWGFAVVADSAQFSAIVSEHAPVDHVGTALTLQTSLGFLLTLVTIEGMPRLADAVGWRWAALLLVPGPLLGIAAMRQLTTAHKPQSHRASEP